MPLSRNESHLFEGWLSFLLTKKASCFFPGKLSPIALTEYVADKNWQTSQLHPIPTVSGTSLQHDVTSRLVHTQLPITLKRTVYKLWSDYCDVQIKLVNVATAPFWSSILKPQYPDWRLLSVTLTIHFVGSVLPVCQTLAESDETLTLNRNM